MSRLLLLVALIGACAVASVAADAQCDLVCVHTYQAAFAECDPSDPQCFLTAGAQYTACSTECNADISSPHKAPSSFPVRDRRLCEVMCDMQEEQDIANCDNVPCLNFAYEMYDYCMYLCTLEDEEAKMPPTKPTPVLPTTKQDTKKVVVEQKKEAVHHQLTPQDKKKIVASIAISHSMSPKAPSPLSVAAAAAVTLPVRDRRLCEVMCDMQEEQDIANCDNVPCLNFAYSQYEYCMYLCTLEDVTIPQVEAEDKKVVVVQPKQKEEDKKDEVLLTAEDKKKLLAEAKPTTPRPSSSKISFDDPTWCHYQCWRDYEQNVADCTGWQCVTDAQYILDICNYYCDLNGEDEKKKNSVAPKELEKKTHAQKNTLVVVKNEHECYADCFETYQAGLESCDGVPECYVTVNQAYVQCQAACQPSVSEIKKDMKKSPLHLLKKHNPKYPHFSPPARDDQQCLDACYAIYYPAVIQCEDGDCVYALQQQWFACRHVCEGVPPMKKIMQKKHHNNKKKVSSSASQKSKANPACYQSCFNTYQTAVAACGGNTSCMISAGQAYVACQNTC